MTATVHYLKEAAPYGQLSPSQNMCGSIDLRGSSNLASVTCVDCLALAKDTTAVRGKPIHFISRINWGAKHSRPYRCGANDPHDEASTTPSAVTCDDCLALMGTTIEQPVSLTEFLDTKGVETPTPQRHKPPRMEDANGLNDGVFIFYGTHSDLGGEMEVVPMTSGNVEFTIAPNSSQSDGLVFSLSHLDRADLIRALLHDFHYSPERGGPNDD